LRLPGAEVAGRLVLALVPAAAGQRAEVEQALGDWPFGAEAGPEAVFLPGAVRSLEALAGNDLTGALRLLDGAMAVMLEHASAAPLHQFGVWALLRTVVDDRGEQARSSLRAIPAGQRLVNQAALQYAEAVTAGRAGRLDDASALLATAEQALVELPWLRRLLRLITMTSAVADRWIDPVPLLRASLTEHAAAGEEPFARACRDLLRRAGAPTRRGRGSRAVPPALAALGVTSRELDVLALLAAGASNADIAERLFLSRRTVETHVANLLMRTGAGDRAELRRRVAQGVLPLTQ
jgi:DNA-binding CsgD family transcriptional regulator